MIPTVLQGPDPLPELPLGQMRYVVGSNGTYLERHTDAYHSMCKVEHSIKKSNVSEIKQFCKVRIPALPAHLCREMIEFFRAAYKMHKGEAALVLLYNPIIKEYRWYCPKQTVASTFLEVKFEEPLEVPGALEGWMNFGDAHSHAGCSAYASATDMKDEKFKDGLHIIVGRVNPDGKLDFHIDFVIDQKRFSIAQDSVMPELDDFHKGEQFPKEWLDMITVDTYKYTDKIYKLVGEDPWEYCARVLTKTGDPRYIGTKIGGLTEETWEEYQERVPEPVRLDKTKAEFMRYRRTWSPSKGTKTSHYQYGDDGGWGWGGKGSKEDSEEELDGIWDE